MTRLPGLITALLLVALGSTAWAEGDYPARRVTIIVGLSAGTPADVVARVVADKLSERMGQPVIVEDRPGAGSNIGAADVVRSAPDGYTLFLGTNANTTNPSFNKPNFDFLTDLAPVGMLSDAPLILAVHPSLPATVAGLIAEAKKNPGRLTFGSSGIGTATHLFAELFAYETATRLTHVPYKGSSQTVTDLLAGRIQIMFSPAGTVVQYIKAGKLRGLAVSGHQRLAVLPEMPTFDEVGVKGFDSGFWFGLNAPAKTPPAIIAYLNKELESVLALPDVRAKLIAQTMFPAPSSSESFGAFLRADTKKWAKIVQVTGIKKSN